MAQNHGHSHAKASQDEWGEHHVVPATILNNVMWALIALTILTVVTAKFIHLGAMGPIVAFSIAAVKAYLVMAYFMGLKYDVKENRWIFSTGFIFLAVLFFFCAVDLATRITATSTL